MLLRFDILDDAGDNAVFVNYVCNAEGAFVFFAVKLLFAPSLISRDDFLFGVGKEREWEIILFCEFLMRLYGVGTHADDGVASLLEGCIVVPEVAGFFGAAGRVVLRVEVQDNFSSAQVL